MASVRTCCLSVWQRKPTHENPEEIRRFRVAPILIDDELPDRFIAIGVITYGRAPHRDDTYGHAADRDQSDGAAADGDRAD